MRLDQFLKKTALVRQRGLAKDLCVAGAVSVEGRTAKASHIVRAGEHIVVRMRARVLEVRVLEVPRGNVARRDAGRYVEVLRDTRSDRVTRVLDAEAHGRSSRPPDADRRTDGDRRTERDLGANRDRKRTE